MEKQELSMAEISYYLRKAWLNNDKVQIIEGYEKYRKLAVEHLKALDDPLFPWTFVFTSIPCQVVQENPKMVQTILTTLENREGFQEYFNSRMAFEMMTQFYQEPEMYSFKEHKSRGLGNAPFIFWEHCNKNQLNLDEYDQACHGKMEKSYAAFQKLKQKGVVLGQGDWIIAKTEADYKNESIRNIFEVWSKYEHEIFDEYENSSPWKNSNEFYETEGLIQNPNFYGYINVLFNAQSHHSNLYQATKYDFKNASEFPVLLKEYLVSELHSVFHALYNASMYGDDENEVNQDVKNLTAILRLTIEDYAMENPQLLASSLVLNFLREEMMEQKHLFEVLGSSGHGDFKMLGPFLDKLQIQIDFTHKIETRLKQISLGQNKPKIML